MYVYSYTYIYIYIYMYTYIHIHIYLQQRALHGARAREDDVLLARRRVQPGRAHHTINPHLGLINPLR